MLTSLFKAADWSIHNPLKVWTLHALTEREVRLIVSTLSAAEHRMLWVWKRGWQEWVALSDDAAETLREMEAPADLTDVPEPPALLETDEITAVKVITQGRRMHGRHHERTSIVARAEIIVGNQSFHSRTENVSEGGIKFGQNLPDWVAGYFTVVIYDQAPIEVICMLVEDQKTDKTRVEVVETEDEESQLPRYREWVRQLLLKNGSLKDEP